MNGERTVISPLVVDPPAPLVLLLVLVLLVLLPLLLLLLAALLLLLLLSVTVTTGLVTVTVTAVASGVDGRSGVATPSATATSNIKTYFFSCSFVSKTFHGIKSGRFTFFFKRNHVFLLVFNMNNGH